MEIIGSIWGAIINAPGTIITITGLIAVAGAIWILIKKAITESVQAYEKVKWFIAKYKALFTTGQGKKDYDAMAEEIDQALEAYALILDKLKLKGLAQRLRNLIKI